MCRAPPEAQEIQKGTKHSWPAGPGREPSRAGLGAGEHSAVPVASPILTTQPLYQVPLPLTHSPHRSNCHGADNGAELVSTMPGHLQPSLRDLGRCSFGTQGRLSAGSRAEVGGPHTPILLSRVPPHSQLFLLLCTLETFCVTFAGVCLWLAVPAWHQRGGSTSWKVTDLFWGGGVHRSLSRRHPGVNTCNGVRASPPLIYTSAGSWRH